jgi:hypothetical protein
LLLFIGSQGRALWHEWSVLRTEMSRVRASAVIGYPGINPHYSYAQRPVNWFRNEGEDTLIWGGWKHGVGHQWFRVKQGEVDQALMSDPMGRDVIQAIDEPVVERGGGTIWDRIPDEAFVVGQRLGGVDTVYPLLILDKVIVVNDTVEEQPYLVTTNPLVPRPFQVAIYETVVDGHRVTMGLTGYFHDGKPLLYDRGTESLWVADPEALRAIAGAHRGRQLRSVARPVPIAWGRWRSEHPTSRLVVGANRAHPRPDL